MTTMTEARLPGLLTTARAQIEIVVLGRRKELILAGILLAVIVSSDTLLPALGFDVKPAPGRLPSMSWRLFPFILLGALFWPLSVWASESPGKREYHWSRPIARGVHDLVRVWAGAAVLMAGLAAVAALGLAIEQFRSGAPTGPSSLAGWSNFFLGPLLAYLIGSIFAVRFNRPDLWLTGVAVGCWAVFLILARLNLDGATDVMVSVLWGRYGLIHALTGGMVSDVARWPELAAWEARRWMVAGLLWFTLAVFGVVAAARMRR
jgi:hypothetical protein